VYFDQKYVRHLLCGKEEIFLLKLRDVQLRDRAFSFQRIEDFSMRISLQL